MTSEPPRSNGLLARLQRWAKALKRDVLVVWLAARDPRTPWSARLLGAAVAAYALSPIDLIPDFIPVLGYLDDVLIVPAGIWLVMRLIPAGLLEELRLAATERDRPRSLVGAVVIVVVWIAAALLAWRWWSSR